ncbi:hypothetical protein BGX24_007308, partial [Mortierella sp. AD032]
MKANVDGAMDSVMTSFRSGTKRLWYPALQGARVLVREGRLADFERVIYNAPCRHEHDFQRGISQLLGEMAMDPVWTEETRIHALELLGRLYRSEEQWISDAGVKETILGILRYVAEEAELIIQGHALAAIPDLTIEATDDFPRSYPLAVRLSLP